MSGRNKHRLNHARELFSVKTLEWKSEQEYCSFPYIVSCIGPNAPTTIFSHQSFFSEWNGRHLQNQVRSFFVDFGEQPVIETPLSPADGVYRLPDILESFTKAPPNSDRNSLLLKAKEHIKGLASRRRTEGF
jgi:hypothetical protein